MTDPAPHEINCYLIPGLGATVEIFSRLDFPTWMHPQPINWIRPSPAETLKDYARRLLNQVDQTTPFVLLGCSFGGAVAVEMAKQTSPKAVILISSIPTSTYLPRWYRLAGLTARTPLVDYSSRMPIWLLRRAIGWSFGTQDSRALDMMCRLVKEADPHFMSWAIKALLNWESTEAPQNTIQIHGDNDRILPLHRRPVDFIVPGEGHLAVFTRSAEISRFLSEALLPIDPNSNAVNA